MNISKACFLCSKSSRGLLLGLLLVIGCESAMAVLGKTLPVQSATSSAAIAAARLQAVNSQSVPLPYTVVESTLESGTTVREYAQAGGPVFAVAWTGPVLPELGVLLGDHFGTFVMETERARMQGRRGSPFVMDRSGLVLHSGGRMGNFSGYAFLPLLVPSGLNVLDVVQ